MFSRKVPTILFCGIVCWLMANTAQAGFVSPDFLDCHSGLDNYATGGAGAESRPVSESPAVPNENKSDHAAFDALVELGNRSSPAGSTGSMAGGSSSSSAGTAAMAVSALPDVKPCLVAAYRLYKSDLLLPIPFLDGIFRPPRSLLAA
jgi:hypothetical protein